MLGHPVENSESQDDFDGNDHRWVSLAGSPWFLRKNTYSEPNGNYNSGCWLSLKWKGGWSDDLGFRFDDEYCNYCYRDYLCEACAAGKHHDDTDPSNPCVDCAKGKSSGEGATECSDCEAGRFAADDGDASCLECPAGTYSGPGASVCLVCGSGTFSVGGAVGCTSCGAGGQWSANQEGATSSEACECEKDFTGTNCDLPVCANTTDLVSLGRLAVWKSTSAPQLLFWRRRGRVGYARDGAVNYFLHTQAPRARRPVAEIFARSFAKRGVCGHVWSS